MIRKLKTQIRAVVFLILTITAIGIFLTVNITNYQSTTNQEYDYLRQLTQKDHAAKDEQEEEPRKEQEAADTVEGDASDPKNGSGDPGKAPAEANADISPAAETDGANSSEAVSETTPLSETAPEIERIYYPSYVITFSRETGEALYVTLRGNTTYSEEDIAALAQELIDSDNSKGMRGNLRYYIRRLSDNDTKIALLESHAKSRFFSSLIRSAFFCLALSLVFLLIANRLAILIVRPVDESFSRQKQFISDASHELKTPITVINANMELLRQDVGENKWMDYIEQEGQRMNALITDLLTLSRLENSGEKLGETQNFCRFDLSSALLGTALSFESVAFEQGVSYDVQIAPDILFTGNETALCQLAAILLDNAMKYTLKDGSVKIGLAKSVQKKHTCRLTVANTGDEIPKEDREKIFDRFYRTDKSRDRLSGGFGLGLAIAKSIAEQHGGSIHIECADGWNSFVVLL